MRSEKCDLIFTLEDTGIGISPEFIGSIFDAFQQDKQISVKYGGTGLGLTITKRLVEMMNGDISVKSKPGVGSTFEITLRNVAICETPSLIDAITGYYDNIIFENAVILIADDILSNRELIKAFFNEMQVRIIEAQDGQEAVFFAGQHEPDIILMDIRMPLMDGYEAARQIRNHEKLKSVPIFAISASALTEDREKIMQSGLFDGFFAKPVRRSEIFRELSRFIKAETGKETSEKIYGITETKHLPTELIGKLENELMLLWEEGCKSHLFGDIEMFADKLRAAGNKYSSDIIIEYGQELITHIRNFDIEKITPLLYSYPKMLDNIKENKSL